jgi:hypothetical protein
VSWVSGVFFCAHFGCDFKDFGRDLEFFWTGMLGFWWVYFVKNERGW